MRIDGECHCGAVAFTAEIDPTRVTVCHCTDCQVFSGSPFRVVAVAAIDTFQIQGKTKSYVKVADSGNHRAQVFCPECGTPLFGSAVENATSVSVRLGCVKQRAQLVPSAQIWQRSSLPWLSELDAIPGLAQQQASAQRQPNAQPKRSEP